MQQTLGLRFSHPLANSMYSMSTFAQAAISKGVCFRKKSAVLHFFMFSSNISHQIHKMLATFAPVGGLLSQELRHFFQCEEGCHMRSEAPRFSASLRCQIQTQVNRIHSQIPVLMLKNTNFFCLSVNIPNPSIEIGGCVSSRVMGMRRSLIRVVRTR